MCDLWVNTLEAEVSAGAVPEQIRKALAGLPPARHLKLYNAGSFFDPRAIPPVDHGSIAALASPFERVVVESHPALVGESCFRFHELLGGRLEVALGLETAHPDVLGRLNKGMTLDDFRRAAAALRANGISVRAFVLVGLPFLTPKESRDWCRRSVEFAFDCGCTAVALIATRPGNGALDAIAQAGDFAPPTLGMLEACLADGIALGGGRVFADLWDLERLEACASCFARRAARLNHMNLVQRIAPAVSCPACGTAP
jgi:radical SAM enzyme (TIGR01210 family)